MSYTALEKMREMNRREYGIDAPVVPEPVTLVRNGSGIDRGSMTFSRETELETRALHFIRERCEDLRFDPALADLTDLKGKSLKPGQIPLNMERDIDRLCLECAVHRFLESGLAEDAFDIYYIYLELFLGEYKKSRRLIERLSEFESNASSLLMKHRDHYSHSVYVFLIGLAVFDTSETYRSCYRDFYGLEEGEDARHFLQYWGLASLFHDVGYPFELPFEEIKSYLGETGDPVPYLGYRNIPQFLSLKEEDREKARRMSPGAEPADKADIFIRRIEECFGGHYGSRPRAKVGTLRNDAGFSEYLRAVFQYRAEDPGAFEDVKPDAKGRYTYNKFIYMDHAYFSALLLMNDLFGILKEEDFNVACTDALTAIVLHNSIFKHILQNRMGVGFDPQEHALRIGEHPLAYLLMLCDELQCWDRIAYGQTSRLELHAMACDLHFDEEGIRAEYQFDEAMRKKAMLDGVKGTYAKMKAPDSEGVTKFQREIEEIVALNRSGAEADSALRLRVTCSFKENTRYRKTYLSHSEFMHLYDFATILSGRREIDVDTAAQDPELRDRLTDRFENKSLEYKLIDIERVKKFAKYLDAIGCFYTDRPVAYPPLLKFREADADVIGPMEHERWLWVHHIMGWTYGTGYLAGGSALRERTRTHKLMLENETYNHENALAHYRELPPDEQDKDTEPMNKLVEILSVLDGVKFYRLAQEPDDTM